MLLEERGLKVVDSLDALGSPTDSVIVQIGKQGRTNSAYAEKLLTFAKRGGTVLLALDGTESLRIVSFTSTAITSEDSATQYQGHSDCLRVSDLERSHPLTKGLSELIVNRSGWLALRPSQWMSWEVLATVPETCSPRRSRGQPLIAASLSDVPDAGTMIVAADPSLFTNSMLWHGDNALFAIRVSELLCRGEKRRLVFLVDGQPLPSYRASPLLQRAAKPEPQKSVPFSVPIQNAPPPKPTMESALRLANSVIQNVEESNILNEALINQPRPLNRRLYTWIVLVGLVAIMAAWLTLKMEHTAAVNPPSPSARTMKTAMALLNGDDDQGRQYGEAAQLLARDFCQELSAGGPPSSDSWHCLDNPAIQPSLERMSASQRRELASLIELAASSEAPHISSRRLQQIGLVIHSLRNLHRDVRPITT
ncbi:MAG: DUF4350 domain-containing protein [Planctomycetaceae bacterium]